MAPAPLMSIWAGEVAAVQAARAIRAMKFFKVRVVEEWIGCEKPVWIGFLAGGRALKAGRGWIGPRLNPPCYERVTPG